MKKHILIKILIILLPVLIVSLYFVAPWFPLVYTYLADWWEARQEREPTVKEMRKYYENLPEPKLTSEAVITQMVKQKGLLRNNPGLIKMVEWYVYHGDKQVIKQLIANLPFEVELSLPEEREKGMSLRGRDTVGKSFFILQNKWGLLKNVSSVLHEELHRYAAVKADVHLIYLIIRLIGCNDPLVKRSENDVHYIEGGGVYHDIDWYTEDLVQRDVLAYLRIYVNYKNWPTVRDTIVSIFVHYPGDWLHSSIMRDVLSVADEKGVEAAYELFLKQGEEK
jgi:hypothetical protein